MIVFVYETDNNMFPTGREWTFKTKSLRDAISHVSFVEKGKVDSLGKSITFDNGNRAFGIILEK